MEVTATVPIPPGVCGWPKRSYACQTNAFAAVHHDDWCPLLRVEQEKPPGLGRWQAVLRSRRE